MAGAAVPYTLTTPRLTLRPLTAQDAPDLRRIVTLPQVGRMLFLFPPDWTDAAAREFIATWQFQTDPLRGRLAICDGAGRMIGSVGLMTIEGRVEMFYFLDPAVGGQGFASEAVGAFVTDARDRFGLTHLHADVFFDNPASARVLEKLGFQKYGEGVGTSAARLEPAPVSLYRL